MVQFDKDVNIYEWVEVLLWEGTWTHGITTQLGESKNRTPIEQFVLPVLCQTRYTVIIQLATEITNICPHLVRRKSYALFLIL